MEDEFESVLRARIDGKTKPVGALGRIEALAAQVARIQRSLTPRMETCRLSIFAGDHGIAEEGVSAYPPEVTRQMVLNFAAGGAASSVFARTLDIELRVVNAGVLGGPVGEPGVIDAGLGEGTENFLHRPAMADATLDAALSRGAALERDGAADASAFGEMGIANSSAAAVIAHKLTGQPLDVLIGRGTGLDDAGLAHKRQVLMQAAERTRGAFDARRALREYGGFEIAMMTGAMIAAAELGRVVLVDGYIATAAALAAARMKPRTRAAMVFAHGSAEPGHRQMLVALDATPLLTLDMRLGEGTGAALAWPLLKAAAAMLTEMASFEDAAVTRRP